VKGLIVVLLPAVVLTLTSGSVYVTERAHSQSEQQREAAESVVAAIDRLRATLDQAAAAYERVAVSGPTLASQQRFGSLESYWQAAVRDLVVAARAQPDAALRADARGVHDASDELHAVMTEWMAGAPGSALPAALAERAIRAVETVEVQTKAASARAQALAAKHARDHQRLARWLKILTLFGAPFGIAAAMVTMAIFGRSFARRIRLLEANARALGEGRPLEPLDHAADELGQLGQGLDRAAALLREREDATRASEQQLAIALEAGAMGVWTADLLTGASAWSKRCELVHGMPPGTFGGTFDAWIGAVHPDDRAGVLAANGEAMAGGGRWTASYRMLPADGSTKWIEIHAQTVADDSGRIVGLVGIATDVTERRSAEIALQDAMAEAKRSNSAKSEFLSRVSHELRTPLNAILGFGQLLEMDDLSKEQDESVAQVLRGGRHLLAVIDDVLDVSRIESGMLSMSVEPVDLTELVNETMSLIAPMAVAQGVRLEPVAATTDPVHVMADRRRLKQVILNLASNAIKFNHPGGAVTFHCSSDVAGRVRLDVVDTGPGIAAELLGRLFTPFDRLGAEQTPVEGTGIGLALSQRLANVLGGRITVDSVVGVGSTFSLDLPRAGCPPVDGTAQEEAVHEATGVSGAILYIEDNPSNLRLVQRVLARRPDIRLVSAQTGEMGLTMAARVPFDLILLDLHLPEMSGEDVLRQLRGSPATATTPIVVVSADATTGQIERLRDSGATDYVTKPLDVHQFLRVIDGLLAGAHA
jgi:PAS domain S-box-containing protein